MPNFVSPGVYVIEKDISEYAPTLDSSIVGIVGFASKGPPEEATLITSPNQLVSTFGSPSEDLYGQGLEGALEILEATNKIYFVRALSDQAQEASTEMPIGACPAALVCPVGWVNKGNGIDRSSDDTGDTKWWGTPDATDTLVLEVQVFDNNGIPQGATKTYTIPPNSVETTGIEGQHEALSLVVGTGELTSDEIFAEAILDSGGAIVSSCIVGSYAGSGASIAVRSFDEDYEPIAWMASVTYSGGNVTLDASDTGSNVFNVMLPYVEAAGFTSVMYDSNGDIQPGVAYKVDSLFPGNSYNYTLDSQGNVVGNSIETQSYGKAENTLTVNTDGAAEETFLVSLQNDSDYFNFIEDVINVGNINLTSNIIKGNVVGGDATSDTILDLDFGGIQPHLWGLGAENHFNFKIYGKGRTLISGLGGAIDQYDAPFLKLVETTNPLAGGDDGMNVDAAVLDAAIIGNPTAHPLTGMQAFKDESLDISLALTPGVHSQSVQNSLVTLAEETQNFVAVLSPPEGIGSVQDAVGWTNGASESSRTAAINSSYAAVYWPHVKVFSIFDGKDRWYDPAIFATRQMVYTDSVADPWFAPAGLVRGRLTKPSDVEVTVNQGDRDVMYGGGNIVNPIAKFPKQGIAVFGQRTAQRAPTALDRVNVRRLMVVLKKTIIAATRTFIFEPNDKVTWEKIEGVINPFLADISRRRGIISFKVICDESTNTPLRVDRNELWCKVLVKPTKAAEMIVFELNITNQAANLGG